MKNFVKQNLLLISGIVLSLFVIFVTGFFLLKEKEPVSTEVDESYCVTDETETQLEDDSQTETETETVTEIVTEVIEPTEVEIDKESEN